MKWELVDSLLVTNRRGPAREPGTVGPWVCQGPLCGEGRRVCMGELLVWVPDGRLGQTLVCEPCAVVLEATGQMDEDRAEFRWRVALKLRQDAEARERLARVLGRPVYNGPVADWRPWSHIKRNADARLLIENRAAI